VSAFVISMRQRRAFTLVELLIAMTILSLVVILLASLLSGVSRAWTSGEQQVETFQDGRAILELMSRELAQAVISPKLQLVQNPTLTGAKQRANSSNLFWQVGLTATNSGNLCEVGYFLAEDTTQHIFQLKRFFVLPTDTTNYQIFANAPNDKAALWVTIFVGTAALNTTISDRVVALWVLCFDSNGDTIPWLSSAATTNGDTAAAPLQFNSAAHFQPAIPGQSSSFKYTSASSTGQAHLAPATVELTIVTVDSKTMQRSRASISALPVLTGPQDIPNAIVTFNQSLIANKIRAARTFSTRVTLKSSGQ
jgi:prepilin-type N-terminal cleavage/methylation domain-containing protein